MKVLLVEDTRSVAMVMAARMQSIGHEVTLAANGKEAVDRFIGNAPDLVIMDIDMPVMNGFEATQCIREYEARSQQGNWTPIIFLTASDTLENLKTAIEAGGDDFLPKSAPEAVLLAKMTAMARIAALRGRLMEANRKLEWLATRDPLTSLCNRRQMNSRIDALWAEAAEDGGQAGLLLIDIDNFKKYNDHYGHQAGDDCLIKVAQIIDAGADHGAAAQGDPASCFAARYGGEEFCVAVGHATREHVAAIAATIQDSLKAAAIQHQLNAEFGCVTLSIGAWLGSPSTTPIAEAFRAADAALYHSKGEGRNRVTFA